MSHSLRITLDGQPQQVRAGATLLQVLQELGVEVPQLCHDPRLEPRGLCRLCLVEVAGQERPVASCVTAAAEGMSIRTHTPALQEARRTTLRLLAWRYPADAVLAFPEQPFHRALRACGLEGEARGARPAELRDGSHPYLHVDLSQCIQCFRCVRICEEVQGQFVWKVWNRGERTRIAPDSGTTLLESSCVSCGACVDTCPTGALEDRTVLQFGAPEAWTRTTCPYCGVGCEMQVGTRAGQVVTVRPAQDAPVNRGHLCSKGRYAFGFLRARDRPTTPMLREGSRWREVSWDEALAHVAARLKGLIAQHGPACLGMLGSARATNEENYLAQKFARQVLFTNNVDCCARVCHAPSAAALRQMLGTGASTNAFDDIERARTLLVCGSNATENHPVVGARIKQAALRGAQLVVIDPRRIELSDYAAIHLQPRIGTNIPLLQALAHTIVAEGLVDRTFAEERVEGLEEFQAFISAWPAERAASLCGVKAEQIRRAARLYATGRPAMSWHGLGLTEHTQGTEAVMCLINLALLTGNLARPGTGINPLRGQNNVQGSAHMGCEPGHLTGSVSLAEGRERFERAWGAPLPDSPGLDLMQMLDAARAGRLRGLWAMGYDVYLTNPDARATREALASLDLLVVQDLFLTETARALATVFLPAAAAFEKEGTFMNAERRVQRVRRAVEPPPGARTDWEILCSAAQAMGRPEGFQFQSAEEIWDEVRGVWPAGAGLAYSRLERGGLQWPCPDEAHPGTPLLHAQSFPHGKRARLRQVEFHPSPEAVSADYPFMLTTGRTLYQFNAGTMTDRTPSHLLHPQDVLSISPQDVDRLDLKEGERVRLESRYGRAELAIHPDDRLRPGELFATFHTSQAFLNQVTGPHRDPQTNTPEYKVTAVRIVSLGRTPGRA